MAGSVRDFRVGMIAYATKQGLGYLAKSFYDAGLIDQVMLVHHGSRKTHPEWYDNRALNITKFPLNKAETLEFLKTVDVMLCFETPFDWNLLDYCREAGVKTICMPMYEWYPQTRVGDFDLYLCPSALDCDYFPGNPLFVPPVDPSSWKPRTRACTFLHNAGNVGHRQHKGTVELLKAIPYLRSDLSLTIRCQDIHEFRKTMKASGFRNDPRVSIQMGEVPYEHLFAEHDVYVAPEKFNGLSLPLQEAFAAGMLVITTNRHPANTWLPNEPMIPVASYSTASIGGSYLSFQEAKVSPKDIAAVMDAWYDRDISSFSNQGLQWAKEHSWAAQKDKCISLMRSVLCPA